MSLKSFDGLVGELKVIARQKGLDINKANAAKSALVGLHDLGFYQKSYEKDIETYQIQSGEDWLNFFKAKQLLLWSNSKEKFIWWTEATASDELQAGNEAHIRQDEFDTIYQVRVGRR